LGGAVCANAEMANNAAGTTGRSLVRLLTMKGV
jgi:hypothetical protein